jgi:hypothetical protein
MREPVDVVLTMTAIVGSLVVTPIVLDRDARVRATMVSHDLTVDPPATPPLPVDCRDLLRLISAIQANAPAMSPAVHAIASEYRDLVIDAFTQDLFEDLFGKRCMIALRRLDLAIGSMPYPEAAVVVGYRRRHAWAEDPLLSQDLITRGLIEIRDQIDACGAGSFLVDGSIADDGWVFALTIDEASSVEYGQCVADAIWAKRFAKSSAGGLFEFRR